MALQRLRPAMRQIGADLPERKPMLACQLQGFRRQSLCFLRSSQAAMQQRGKGQRIGEAEGMAKLPRECHRPDARRLGLIGKTEKPHHPRIIRLGRHTHILAEPGNMLGV